MRMGRCHKGRAWAVKGGMREPRDDLKNWQVEEDIELAKVRVLEGHHRAPLHIQTNYTYSFLCLWHHSCIACVEQLHGIFSLTQSWFLAWNQLYDALWWKLLLRGVQGERRRCNGTGLFSFVGYSHHSGPSIGTFHISFAPRQEVWLGLVLSISPCSAADFFRDGGILLPVPAPVSICRFCSVL